MQVICTNCSKEFNKFPAEVGKNNFCTKSCAGVYNGKKFPKRKLQGLCKLCHTQIPKRSTYCDKCWIVYNNRFLEDTIEDVCYEKHHKSSAFALIRHRARKLLPKGPCEECEFPHTEVCHLKAISSFPKDTKLSVVNSRSNLRRLCPNCHWLLDHPKTKMVREKRLELLT